MVCGKIHLKRFVFYLVYKLLKVESRFNNARHSYLNLLSKSP